MADRKRRPHVEEEPVVDDLAVAAQYAALTAAPGTADVDEIVLDEEEDETHEPPTHHADKSTVDNDTASDTDNDDDESDVDLEEQLANMTDDQGGATTAKAPTTAHEVDAYRSSADELQAALKLNLSIHETEMKKRPRDFGNAGKVHHFIEDERTLIVQSVGTTLLHESTILWLQINNDYRWIGRIFEVFGPVSQPLYSIRLPPADPDPWAAGGECRQWMEQPTNEVFYAKDMADVLNPSEIYRTSKRGCDASNLFDEEVPDNELDYSDDEQERSARQKNRRGRPTAPSGFFPVAPPAPMPPPPPPAPPVAPVAPSTTQSDTIYYDYD